MEQIVSTKFNIRDSNLPSLLTEVAIDVDNKISRRADDRKSINKLREIFYGWQEQGIKGLEENTLFAEAIGLENFASTHNSEIPLKINLLFKELNSYKELPAQRLEILRDFCVDLSKRFRDYQTDFYSKYGRLAVA